VQKQISQKIISLVFSVLILCFAIAFYVVGWSEPFQAPPNCTSGNPGCDPPVNVGPATQVKSGALGIIGVLRGFSTINITGNSTDPVGGACPFGYDWYDDDNKIIDDGECKITSLYTTLDGNVGIGTTSNLNSKLNILTDGGSGGLQIGNNLASLTNGGELVIRTTDVPTYKKLLLLRVIPMEV